MELNIGTVDRVIRGVVGIALIALAATGTIGWWGWLGLVPLGTAIVKFCPLYTLFGWNTCTRKP